MNLNKKCIVSYCSSVQTSSKGYCLKHYTQVHRHGKIKEKIVIQGSFAKTNFERGGDSY